MATKKTKLSTEEKFRLARKGLESGKYKTIEEAAMDVDMAPASYYNYQNKLKAKVAPSASGVSASPSSLTAREVPVSDLKAELVRKNNYIQTLQEELTAAKEKILELVLKKPERQNNNGNDGLRI